MEIGIIGLPQSGKTTVFNALTKGKASVASYSGKPNIGVAKVPDYRIDNLAELYQPRKVVPAEVTYTDVPPPPEGFGETKGIGGEYLNDLQNSEALVIVIRAFEDPSIPHVDETIDPFRDGENLLMEMTFSDLDILDRRVTKVKSGFKSAKAQERDYLNKELATLEKFREKMDAGIALRDQTFTTEESRQLSGFGFLSNKPVIIVLNIDEQQLSEAESLETKLSSTFSGTELRTTVICAKLEMELAQMEQEDELVFRKDLGMIESSLSKMIKVSYDVVGQIAFFTVGEDEVRAWEIRVDTAAQKAAGKIHTDLERGFIRAEVVPYEDLIQCRSLSESRKRGVLRQEGKDYIVKDGDIMHVLFNV